MESEQLRKENDTSGPQDELEYWKRRAAQFSQLLAHMQVGQINFISENYYRNTNIVIIMSLRVERHSLPVTFHNLISSTTVSL